MKKLSDIDVFLFDMDGTLNMGERPIDGAMETLRILTEKGKKVYFVTNNSSKARIDYQKKIARLGYNAELDQIVTSGMATASYLNKNFSNSKIYVLGTETLKNELRNYDIHITEEEDADVMVLAFDTELTYQKLWKATNIVAAGTPYAGRGGVYRVGGKGHGSASGRHYRQALRTDGGIYFRFLQDRLRQNGVCRRQTVYGYQIRRQQRHDGHPCHDGRNDGGNAAGKRRSPRLRTG